MIRVWNRTTQVRFPLKNRRFPLTSTFLKAAIVLNTPSVFSSSIEWEARVCIRRSIPVRALISAIIVFGSSCGQGLRFRLWWFWSARIAERARRESGEIAIFTLLSSANEEHTFPSLRDFNPSHSTRRCQDLEQSIVWYVACGTPFSSARTLSRKSTMRKW